MRQRTSGTISAMVLITALAAGCAGPAVGISDSASAAIPPATDIAGTWHGTFGWVGGWHYTDEGKVTLDIKDNGTFTATVERNGATNNLAKPATWAGTAVARGNGVTLRDTGGSWPTIALRRSGNNVLYDVANDPATESPVMMKFERVGQ
ncbi:MAG TPA: hypothetical protein VGL09_00120 [Methylomirabilota bacterium]